MNEQILGFQPEPFEIDLELQQPGEYQEFDFEGVEQESEADFEVEEEGGRRRSFAGGRASTYIRPHSKVRMRPQSRPVPRSLGTKRPPIPRPRPAPIRTRGLGAIVSEPYGLTTEPYPGEQEPAGTEYVRWVQSCLNQVMVLQLPLDGNMGPPTRSAIRSFQQRQGLRIDGIVGPDTEQALKDACKTGTPVTPASEPAGNEPNSDAQSGELPWAHETEWEFDGVTSMTPNLVKQTKKGVPPMKYAAEFKLEPFLYNTGESENELIEMEQLEYLENEVNRNSSDYVRWVQESLNKVMGLKLKVDGLIGPQTRSAIRSFQAARSLVTDGIVGPKTEAAFVASGVNRPPSQIARTPAIKPGQTLTGLVHPYQMTPNLQDQLLYDFDINDARLKPAHKLALDNVIKFMADDARARLGSGKRWVVSLDGYASRTGDPEWNRELSRQRMYSVNDYMRAHLYVDFDLTPYVDFNTKWHGFDETTVPGENPWGRSVRVAAHRPNTSPPPPRKIPPFRACPKSTNWQIRMHGAFSAGVPLPLPGNPVLAGDCAIFELNDLTNKRVGYFYFLGLGVAVGVKLPWRMPPVTPTSAGPYTCFSTTKPVCLESFEGNASFGQPPAIGPFSLGTSVLGFEGPIIGRTSWGQIGTTPKYIPIRTGSTILNIFSSTRGRFKRGLIVSSPSVSRQCST